MKKLSQLFILALLLLVSSCDMPWCKKDFSGRVLNCYKNQMDWFYGPMYEYASKTSRPLDYLVQLTEITPFEWDTLVWVSDSLDSEAVSKRIGIRYEDKSEYRGKRKIFFMNNGRVADIYALREKDSIMFIPGDVCDGFVKVSRDTWFTVRADAHSFTLKRYGISLDMNKDISVRPPRFKIKNTNYVLRVFSDTMKTGRESCYGYTTLDQGPLMRKIAKEVFTDRQLSKIKQVPYMIQVEFCFYFDTGEVFEYRCDIEDRYESLVSDEQWERFSEIMLNIHIDPRLIHESYLGPCSKEKRLFTGSFDYLPSALIY